MGDEITPGNDDAAAFDSSCHLREEGVVSMR